MALGDSTTEPRSSLTALRNGLLRLHKVVLDSERGIYEREIERIRAADVELSVMPRRRRPHPAQNAFDLRTLTV